ncbi:SRPBCC family protein [Niabella insulamsoli]|uniref:hypothetical protein n=1 Tax=Niabella insulamsoli TaxID=3144874 RepID=UPI0031FC9BCB
MKYLRLFVLSFIVFFALACIVSFFIPSHVRIFRMVRVAKERTGILDPVRDLAQWKTWYPGFETIALQQPQRVDNKVVKAAIDKVLIEVTESSDSLVVVKMQKDDRPVISGWQINKDQKSDSLALQAYMDFKLKWYPWEKFSSLLLDKSYGDRMKHALENLKNKN